MKDILNGLSLACAVYFIAYNMRDLLLPSIKFIIGSYTDNDQLASSGRAPWRVRRIAARRRKYRRSGDKLTEDEHQRISRTSLRYLKMYVISSAIVKYGSPIVLGAMPIKIALQFQVYGYTSPAAIFLMFIDMFWMYLAWIEIKNNGPWWKRKRDRLMEKVKQTVDGRLTVVPVSARSNG